MPARLAVENLWKAYDGQPVVKDFSLAVAEGEFVALLGPSGCGKSTILAMIAGFERPDAGSILLEGRAVDGLTPQRRRIGFVMQDYAVFPRMTVRQNLEFGLKAQRFPGRVRSRRLAETAERLALGAIWNRRGATLNLSEMQRVALGRALATHPSLLLLDEPLSNLDAFERGRLRGELKRIQQESGQTVLYVTHDQVEAMSMADRIVVLQEGAIEQVGTPAEVYGKPANLYVARFIGDPSINLVPCTLKRKGDEWVARTSMHEALVLPLDFAVTDAAVLAIRPHHVRVALQPGQDTVPAPVDDVENFGAEHVVHLGYGPQRLTAIVRPGYAAIGQTVHVAFDLAHALLIDPATDLVVPSQRRTIVA